MEQHQLNDAIIASWPSVETTKLIRKLRWIGLVEEADQLQRTSVIVHPRQQGILAGIPYSTD